MVELATHASALTEFSTAFEGSGAEPLRSASTDVDPVAPDESGSVEATSHLPAVATNTEEQNPPLATAVPVDPRNAEGLAVAAIREHGAGVETRVAVLHLGRPRHQADPGGYSRNILGIHVTAEELRRVGRRLQAEHIEVVVLDVTLQGGYWSEAAAIQQVLTSEFLPHFRTVAWIDEAVGGAALAFSVVPEIYFRPSGVFGPCPVAASGTVAAAPWITAPVASSGAAPEPLLDTIRTACRVGGHDFLLFRSMMLAEPLSALPDAARPGVVQLRAEEIDGKVVNQTGHLLTLTATNARQLAFSRGTADTLEQLLSAMRVAKHKLAGQEAAVDLEFAAAQARTDESRLLELMESIRSRILLTDSAIEGWERDSQAEMALRDLDELEYILSRNALYRVYFADEAKVPEEVGALNRIWFDALRQGIDALRRRRLPLDEVADSIQM